MPCVAVWESRGAKIGFFSRREKPTRRTPHHPPPQPLRGCRPSPLRTSRRVADLLSSRKGLSSPLRVPPLSRLAVCPTATTDKPTSPQPLRGCPRQEGGDRGYSPLYVPSLKPPPLRGEVAVPRLRVRAYTHLRITSRAAAEKIFGPVGANSDDFGKFTKNSQIAAPRRGEVAPRSPTPKGVDSRRTAVV